MSIYDKLTIYLRPIAIVTLGVIVVNITFMIVVCSVCVKVEKSDVDDTDSDSSDEEIKEKFVPSAPIKNSSSKNYES